MENGWGEYQRLVLTELKQNTERIDEIYKVVNKLSIDLAVVTTKASLWGTVMGFLSGALVTFVAEWINNGK